MTGKRGDARHPPLIALRPASVAGRLRLLAGLDELQRFAGDRLPRRPYALRTRCFRRLDDRRRGTTRGLDQLQPGIRRQAHADRRHLDHCGGTGAGAGATGAATTAGAATTGASAIAGMAMTSTTGGGISAMAGVALAETATSSATGSADVIGGASAEDVARGSRGSRRSRGSRPSRGSRSWRGSRGALAGAVRALRPVRCHCRTAARHFPPHRSRPRCRIPSSRHPAGDRLDRCRDRGGRGGGGCRLPCRPRRSRA